MYSDSLSYAVAAERLKAELEILKAELGTRNPELAPGNAADEAARTEQTTTAFESLAQQPEAMAAQRAVKPWWRGLLRRAG
jgi:hypothetical protein